MSCSLLVKSFLILFFAFILPFIVIGFPNRPVGRVWVGITKLNKFQIGTQRHIENMEGLRMADKPRPYFGGKIPPIANRMKSFMPQFTPESLIDSMRRVKANEEDPWIGVEPCPIKERTGAEKRPPIKK